MVNNAELLSASEYIKLLTGLLAIVDIPGNLPAFLNISSDFSLYQRKAIALLTTLVFVMVMGLFAIAGDSILMFFGITLEAFQIAGGLLLLLMALDMMRTEHGPETSQPAYPSNTLGVAIFPLAIPLFAGPGALSMVILYKHRHDTVSHDLLVILVICSVAVLLYLGLRMAVLLSNLLGPTGLSVLNRIMGLIVAAIGIEFIIDGLAVHFPAWVE